MSRRLSVSILLVSVALVLALAGAWWWLHPAAPVSTDLVLYGNVDIRQISLAFSESERITAMKVEEGDHVKSGQSLASLDDRTLQLQLAQAQAQADAQSQALLRLQHGSRPQEIAQAAARVDAAAADLRLAEQDSQRLQGLSADTQGRAASRQDLDRAAAQLRAARARLREQTESLSLARLGARAEDVAAADAQLQAARDAIALLRHRIDLSTLRAPADAVVRSRLAEPGDMASPQKPVYALALLQPKWIRAYVNETQLARVRPGATARVSVDGLPGESLRGRVGFVSSVAEFTPKTVQTPDLRTHLVYEIRVIVDDPEDRLRLGMPATVRLAAPPAAS